VKSGDAPNGRPGAKSTAGTTELREHLGEGGQGNCGRTAEELRKASSLYALPAFFLPALAIPSLICTTGPAERREVTPATPPHPAGSKVPETGPYVATRYRLTRNWCVMHGPELVAVVTYRKGAAELVRRLNASGAAMPVGFET